MAKAKKFTTVQKVLIVAVVLIVVQAVYLFIFSSKKKPLAFMDQVNRSIDQIPGMDPQARQIAKIEMALRNYSETNQGKLPESLDQLVPKYFDKVPVDPATNQPIKYAVTDGNFSLGQPTDTAVAAAGVPVGPSDRKGPLTQEQADQILLASVIGQSTEVAFVYDPSGKRDPFQPFDLSPKRHVDESRSPLERYDIGQLKLTSVLAGGAMGDAIAIVELADGKGYTVRKGTKIGVNSGEVVEIRPDKLLILETSIDFTGAKKTQTIEMPIRTKSDAARN